jgi:hypothetical protein
VGAKRKVGPQEHPDSERPARKEKEIAQQAGKGRNRRAAERTRLRQDYNAANGAATQAQQRAVEAARLLSQAIQEEEVAED